MQEDRVNQTIANNQLSADQRLSIEPIDTEAEGSPSLYVSGNPSITQPEVKNKVYTFNVLRGDSKGTLEVKAKSISIAQEEQIGILLLDMFHQGNFIIEDGENIRFNNEVKLTNIIGSMKNIDGLRKVASIATGIDISILENVSGTDFLDFVPQLLENEPQIQETIVTFFTGRGKISD